MKKEDAEVIRFAQIDSAAEFFRSLCSHNTKFPSAALGLQDECRRIPLRTGAYSCIDSSQHVQIETHESPLA
jgi:hypothetical protein